MGIYLDNAATSYPKPENVAKSVYDFMINNVYFVTTTSSLLLSLSIALLAGLLMSRVVKLLKLPAVTG